MLSRRSLLVAPLLATATGAYGVGIEPLLQTNVTRYRVRPASWPAGLKLKVAVIADIHACEPWMDIERIGQIVQLTNRLGADVIVLLGDYVAGHKKITAIVPDRDWADTLGGLRAPLGVYAILGNHDWWADKTAQVRGRGPIAARLALEKAGIAVLENDNARLTRDGHEFWIAGLGEQEALLGYSSGRTVKRGVDDLEATLAAVPPDAPVILLVHEPDIFPRVPERVSLTLAGHTHGGQVRVLGSALFAPSELSLAYCYGHFFEGERHLIVSGGLGCSWWPVRFGMPPEVVFVEIEGQAS
ncbi:metallophosphoesterase [Rhodopseudomonas palustris]|nr:metallophosphoesterase [Rhodopseudomonas palustris]MCP9626538.1 metallophosphoesterase [Rhodopseudomonas palustris]